MAIRPVSPHDLIDTAAERHEFEVFRYHIEQHLTRRGMEFLREPGRLRFSVEADRCAGGLVARLTAFLVAGDPEEVEWRVRKSIPVKFKVPATWWDHLKRDVYNYEHSERWWWPLAKRLLHRVRWRDVDVTNYAEVDERFHRRVPRTICPHLPGSDQHQHIMFMLGRDPGLFVDPPMGRQDPAKETR